MLRKDPRSAPAAQRLDGTDSECGRGLQRTMHSTRVGNGVFPVDSRPEIVPPSLLFSNSTHADRNLPVRMRGGQAVAATRGIQAPVPLSDRICGKESVSITPIVPLCVGNQRSKKYLFAPRAGARLRSEHPKCQRLRPSFHCGLLHQLHRKMQRGRLAGSLRQCFQTVSRSSFESML